jgi:hypothetical protein
LDREQKGVCLRAVRFGLHALKLARLSEMRRGDFDQRSDDGAP